MKNSWQIKKLGDICNIELGRTPSRNNKSFWDEKRSAMNVWLSIADLLNTKDNMVYNSKEYISDKGAAICKVVKAGTLLLSFKLTLGRLAFAGRDLFTNEAIAALVIKNEQKLSQKFLYYSLYQFDWHAAASSDVKIKGKTLNKAKLKEIEITYPESLSEQQRIVTLLDKAFAAIATAKQNAEKNLQNARELFESYLQNIFVNPIIGWRKKRLGEICELRSGTTLPFSIEKPRGELPYLKVADMNLEENKIHISTSSRFVNKSDINKNGIIPTGSTIFPKRGGAILTNKKRITLVAICMDLNLMAVTARKEILPTLIYYYFLGLDLRKLNNGSSIPQINNYSIEPLIISFPESLSEQQQIVAKLDALSAETKKLEAIYRQKLAALEELKKSLLQKAFNGEL